MGTRMFYWLISLNYDDKHNYVKIIMNSILLLYIENTSLGKIYIYVHTIVDETVYLLPPGTGEEWKVQGKETLVPQVQELSPIPD